MHASLTPKNNVRLSVLWAVVVVVSVLLSPAPLWTLLAFGGVLGAIGGFLQLRAIRDSRPALLAATTALEVRSALRSTRSGTVYIVFLWVSVLLLVGCAFYLLPAALFFAIAAGYATFAFVRELITLLEVFALQRPHDDATRNV